MNIRQSQWVVFVIPCFAMCVIAAQAHAGKCPVNNVTAGNCYLNIQEALDDATAGDEIVLEAGTYTGLGNTNLTFGGKDLILRGETGNPADVIIDCQNIPDTRGFTFNSGETNAAQLADLTITNGNMITGPGGGIFIDDSSPTIRNCAFVTNNTAVWGGGIFHDHGTAKIVDCTFTNNTGVQDGGGMFNGFGHSSVINCTFIGNTARNGGGLIMNAGGTEVTGCTFIRNTAAFNSGGLHIGILAVPVTNCTFLGNSAGIRAGGLFTGAGTFNVIQCVFVGNTSLQFGGAFFNSTAKPTLINCTFANNIAHDTGGAIYNDFQFSIVHNSILRNNSPNEVTVNTGTVNIEYSNVQGGYLGTGNIDADPFFVQSPNDGLDNTWGTTDDDYGDVRLNNNSPSIDAGTNLPVPSTITTDLDGLNRFVDDPTTADTGVAGKKSRPIIDMGAYEFFIECLPDLDGNGVVNVNDLLILIAAWGPCL